MHIGTVFSQADSGTDPDAIRDWAVAAEAAGFHHILGYDHVLGASTERLGDGPHGGFPEPAYTDQNTFHEIFTLFAHLSGIVTDIEFASSVVVLPQRQIALVAKQVANLDRLTGGRFNLSVGVGWNPAEYEGLGVDFSARTAILEEQIEVLRLLFTEPLVSFHGEYHTLEGVGINPRPERPVPIWMGTRGAEPVLRRVARLADGWMPLLIPGVDPFDLPERVGRLRQICEDNGRDPATLAIWGRTYLDGTDSWKERTEQALEIGCSHFSVGFDRFAHPPTPHRQHLDAVIDVLDGLRAITGP